MTTTCTHTTLFRRFAGEPHHIVLSHDPGNACRFAAWSIQQGASQQIFSIEFKIPCSYNELDVMLSAVTDQTLKAFCGFFNFSLTQAPAPCTLHFAPHTSALSQATGCGAKPWMKRFAHHFRLTTILNDLNTLRYEVTAFSLPRELSPHTLPTQELIQALQHLAQDPTHHERFQQFEQLYLQCINQFVSDLPPIDEQHWCRAFSTFLFCAPADCTGARANLPNCIELIQNRMQRALSNGSEQLLAEQLALLAIALEHIAFPQSTQQTLGIDLCRSLKETLERAQGHASLIIASQALYAVELLATVHDDESKTETVQRHAFSLFQGLNLIYQAITTPSPMSPLQLLNGGKALQSAATERQRPREMWMQVVRCMQVCFYATPDESFYQHIRHYLGVLDGHSADAGDIAHFLGLMLGLISEFLQECREDHLFIAQDALDFLEELFDVAHKEEQPSTLARSQILAHDPITIPFLKGKTRSIEKEIVTLLVTLWGTRPNDSVRNALAKVLGKIQQHPAPSARQAQAIAMIQHKNFAANGRNSPHRGLPFPPEFFQQITQQANNLGNIHMIPAIQNNNYLVSLDQKLDKLLNEQTQVEFIRELLTERTNLTNLHNVSPGFYRQIKLLNFTLQCLEKGIQVEDENRKIHEECEPHLNALRQNAQNINTAFQTFTNRLSNEFQIIEDIHCQRNAEILQSQQNTATQLQQTINNNMDTLLGIRPTIDSIHSTLLKEIRAVEFLINKIEELKHRNANIIPSQFSQNIQNYITNKVNEFAPIINSDLLTYTNNSKLYFRNKIITISNNHHARIANEQSMWGRFTNRYTWTPMTSAESDINVIAKGNVLPETQEFAAELQRCINTQTQYTNTVQSKKQRLITNIMSGISQINGEQSVGQMHQKLQVGVAEIHTLCNEIQDRCRDIKTIITQIPDTTNRHRSVDLLNDTINIAQSVSSIYEQITISDNALRHTRPVNPEETQNQISTTWDTQLMDHMNILKYASTIRNTTNETPTHDNIATLAEKVNNQLYKNDLFISDIDERIKCNSLRDALTEAQINTLQTMSNARIEWDTVPTQEDLDWDTLEKMSKKLGTSIRELERMDKSHVGITVLTDLVCNTQKTNNKKAD